MKEYHKYLNEMMGIEDEFDELIGIADDALQYYGVEFDDDEEGFYQKLENISKGEKSPELLDALKKLVSDIQWRYDPEGEDDFWD